MSKQNNLIVEFMKRHLFLFLMALLSCPVFAYRDSVGDDSSGIGGLIFAGIIFGAFIIAIIVGVFRNLFK